MRRQTTLILNENEVKEIIADEYNADQDRIVLRVHNGQLEAVVPLQEEEE